MTRIALFDIDGTLLDSGGAGRRAFVAALQSVLGREVPQEPYDFAGKTDRAILQALLERSGVRDPDHALEACIMESYLDHLDVELARASSGGLYPGVAALLDALHGDPEFRVGLLTGNIERAAHKKLSHFGIERYFAFGAYGSDETDRDRLVGIARERARRMEGSPAVWDPRIVLVGDTPLDVRCARSGGVRILAVATGLFEESILAGCLPDALVTDFADTAAVLRLLRDLTELPPSAPATPGRGP